MNLAWTYGCSSRATKRDRARYSNGATRPDMVLCFYFSYLRSHSTTRFPRPLYLPLPPSSDLHEAALGRQVRLRRPAVWPHGQEANAAEQDPGRPRSHQRAGSHLLQPIRLYARQPGKAREGSGTLPRRGVAKHKKPNLCSSSLSPLRAPRSACLSTAPTPPFTPIAKSFRCVNGAALLVFTLFSRLTLALTPFLRQEELTALLEPILGSPETREVAATGIYGEPGAPVGSGVQDGAGFTALHPAHFPRPP